MSTFINRIRLFLANWIMPRDLTGPITRDDYDYEFARFYAEVKCQGGFTDEAFNGLFACLEIFNRKLWGPRK